MSKRKVEVGCNGCRATGTQLNERGEGRKCPKCKGRGLVAKLVTPAHAKKLGVGA